MEHIADQEGQRMVDEFMTKLAARPLKATYPLATIGAKTERGGEVISASTSMVSQNYRVACVGDLVRYPDGTEGKIASGAGFALAFKGRPFAIIGSAIDNGDKIISSMQNAANIREYADAHIPGLLEIGYAAHWVG